jgi:hypothetical protein
MRYLFLLLALPLLVACQERYRYPCQDPNNWDSKECKKPFCSANGTCPEDLTLYEKDKAGGQPGNSFTPAAPAPAPKKGECK